MWASLATQRWSACLSPGIPTYRCRRCGECEQETRGPPEEDAGCTTGTGCTPDFLWGRWDKRFGISLQQTVLERRWRRLRKGKSFCLWRNGSRVARSLFKTLTGGGITRDGPTGERNKFALLGSVPAQFGRFLAHQRRRSILQQIAVF